MKKKTNLLFCGLLVVSFILNAKYTFGQYDTRYSKWMANSIMKRSPDGYGSWDYVTGTVLRGFQELWLSTGDSIYYDYIKKTVDNVVNADGSIDGYDASDYNIDEIKEGCALLFMYNQTGETKYLAAARHVRQQLANHPRTSEGGFWHKQVYPHQMWLDGLYMGSPFYAEYNAVVNDTQYFSDVVNQIVLMDKHSYDSTIGLFYHGWDESGDQSWADTITGCSASFWGRAIGWYAMAMVDVLDYLPADHTGRDSVIDVLNRLAAGMAAHQDLVSGCWYQVIDKGDSVGNYLESSVSCMITYALAKAVRMGYIDSSYTNVAKKAFKGIVDEFITVTSSSNTINLTKTCATAGLGPTRDGTYNYYINETYYRINDGKGLGPFVLAALEMEKLILPPSDLILASLTTDSLIISWKDNSNNELGFLIYKTDTSNTTIIFELDSNSTCFTDTLLEPFVQYSYKVCLFNSSDTSVYSNTLLVQTLGENGEPWSASNPYPGNNSINIPINIVLTWNEGYGATSHNIYFGKSNPPEFVGNQSINTFSPDALEYDTTYYWRIDEVNDAGVTEGEVWQFTSVIKVGDILSDVANDINILVYPNPFTDYFTINMDLDKTSEFVIELYSSHGQLVLHENPGILAEGNQFIKFDLPYLELGIYCIRININNHNYYKKILKLQ